MVTREELGAALLECLRDVSSLLEHAQSAAARQQEALVRGDAEEIALTCLSQEEILRRIAQADERAAAIATEIINEAGLNVETTDAAAIAQAAGRPYAASIDRELARISELAQRVRNTNEINSRLIANGLDVITSCLRIVAREPEPVVYSAGASLAGADNMALSLDWRV